MKRLKVKKEKSQIQIEIGLFEQKNGGG